MNYKILRLLFAAIAVVGLSSCSMDHRQNTTLPSEGNSETEWTVLFYGAGNTENDMTNDGQSQTAAVVQGLESVYASEKIHAMALVANSASSNECGFYDVHFNPNDSQSRISSEQIRNWGHQDMSSPQLLRQFVDSAAQRYPANHYLLVIGGQGAGWRGSCRDNVAGGGNFMPLPEMEQNLKNSIDANGRAVHIDMLLWLTPSMNTLEAAYQFRGTADYMVATSSVLPQPGFMAVSTWFLDLNLDPAMSVERLGQFLVSRMQQEADAHHDTLATYDLLNLEQIAPLAQSFSDFADSVEPSLTSGRAGDIITMWQSLWDVRTEDSSAIDLLSFVNAVRNDASYQMNSGILDAASRVESAAAQVLTYRRATRGNTSRCGMVIYTPLAPTDNDLEGYDELQISHEHNGWANFLNSMKESGTSLVAATGSVSWPGQTLQNIYLFLNTAQVGAPSVALTSPATVTHVTTPDNVDFQSSFALGTDSVAAYLGMFQDLDNSHTLTTGDRYGYFHRATQLRDWITIHQGDQLDSLHIDLNHTL